jgi:hypothetical protein
MPLSLASLARGCRPPTPRIECSARPFALARPALLALWALGVAAPVARAQTAAPIAATDTSSDDLINADRPGIADGSRVIAAGQVQLETAFQQERHVDGGARSRRTFVPTLLRIGLTPRIEARVESNTFTHERVTADDGAVERSAGLAPVLLGGKLALYDSRGERRRSLGAIVRVAPPSGTDAFRTAHATGDVRLAGDWDFAPELSLNPNLGIARYEGSDGEEFSTALGALTLTYQPTERWNPFVDLGYQSREDSGASWSLIVDAGVGYVVGRDLQLDVSAGEGVRGTTVPKPFVAAGVSLRADVFRRSGLPLSRTHGHRSAQSTR